MNVFQEILKNYWGYSSFRPLQQDIITSVYNCKDTLGLMPTGGGKSIAFQVPTMAMEGLCIVVTPLIALMRDQVDNLRQKGIKALVVYSGMHYQEILTTYDNAIFGDFKFLYISPERLNTTLFLQKIQYMRVCMLVVDEAHCISQWGYDFRPAYLKIASIRKYLGEKVPILALTATATPDVVDDIQEKLEFKEKNVFSKSFERKNLIYYVKNVEDKFTELLSILRKTKGCVLIYVRSRNKTKDISDLFVSEGLSSDYFHAGLSAFEKRKKQDDWKQNKIRIIVCTNAFGMGIDKPDVRLVIHVDLPNSLEEYFQEAGRAGRDGMKAYAIILFGKKDTGILKKRVIDEFPEKVFIQKVYDCLSYFYQVAEGYGEGIYRDFNIYSFAKAYKLPVISTHNALKILSLAGYIDYQDEVNSKSRVIMKITRQELYLHELSGLESSVLNYLLRSYTGLFINYVSVDEVEIAHRTSATRNDVYQVLISLAKRDILEYVPARKDPLICFTIPRQESKYLLFKKEVYKDRLLRSTERTNYVCDYVSQTIMCRSQFLLAYFGEKNKSKCNDCDICRTKKSLSTGIQDEVWSQIQQFLGQKDYSIHELLEQMNSYDKTVIMQILRIALDENRLIFENMVFRINKTGI